MSRTFLILCFGFFVFFSNQAYSQFTPLFLTGYNQDVVAEGGPSSLATTSAALDAAGSNKVMYTTNFAAFAGITAGLPANSFFTSGADTYSLGNYAGNNALFVLQGQSRSLFPAGFNRCSKLRILCFSTEGPSTINISITFSDGTTTNYISNYVLPDWFYGTSNIVLQGFGRCSRTANGPWSPDGLPSNPKIYYLEIVLNCIDKDKLI